MNQVGWYSTRLPFDLRPALGQALRGRSADLRGGAWHRDRCNRRCDSRRHRQSVEYQHLEPVGSRN